MPNDEFEQKRFASVGALIREIQERSDDIESVTIQVANGIYVTGPEGQRQFCRNAGAFIRLCNGSSLLIHRDDAEALLNDGILQRMKLPCKLLPLVKDE